MDTATLPRPDLAAYRRAIQAPFSEIVTELASILGKKLTAYIGGVKDTRVVAPYPHDARPQDYGLFTLPATPVEYVVSQRSVSGAAGWAFSRNQG